MVAAMLWGLLESFVDNVVRDKVSEPAEGGVVYCDLAFGLAEHSGIYLGNGEIMHRNKDGRICSVSPKEFVAGTPAISIYTSCYETWPAGEPSAGDMARFYEKKRNGSGYALLWRNCHIFSSACISTVEENSDTFLWMLKQRANECFGANSWRVWDF